MIPFFVFCFGFVFLKTNSGMVWEHWQMVVVSSLRLPRILLGVYIRKMEFLCLRNLRFLVLHLLESFKIYVRSKIKFYYVFKCFRVSRSMTAIAIDAKLRCVRRVIFEARWCFK
jgi:hypothetical protein